MAASNQFDAIVVGSGMSGGWAAKELTEKGLKTLVLERGRNVRHVQDYTTALKDPWELPHNNRPTNADRAAQPIQSTLYLYDQSTKQFLVDDTKYSYEQAQPFNWFRGYQVGGRSLLWARHVFRFSDLDFEANLKEGVGIDWPIRYADIAPWYDHVERFIGASGENPGLPQLPKQILQPPFEMTALEKHIKSEMAKAFTDRMLICSSIAVLSRELNGRGPCQGRNQCARGCPYSAYFSSNGVTLPAAAATGNLTLQPDSIVHSLIYDEGKQRVTGVRVIDANTFKSTEYFARVVFLCASALNSTAILLNTRSSRYPNGFGNDSGELGHNLMDHHNGGGATASYSGLLDRYYKGRRSTSMYIPRFRNVTRREEKFVRGYGYEVYSGRGNWTRGVDSADFGADFKKRDHAARGVERVHRRVRRNAAVPRQPHLAVARKARSMGHTAAQHFDDLSRQRARDGATDDGRRRGNAHGGQARERQRIQQPGHAGERHPRDGHRTHGTGSQDLGAEFTQPDSRRTQCVRDRRQLHGVVADAESIAHLHGADGTRGGLRRRAVETRRAVAVLGQPT